MNPNKMTFKYSEKDRLLLEEIEIENINRRAKQLKETSNVLAIGSSIVAAQYMLSDGFFKEVIDTIKHIVNNLGFNGNKLAIDIAMFLDSVGFNVSQDLFLRL